MHTQQGDYFVKLISTNKGIIIKIVNSYCNNKTDKDDLAQEIIYQLWKSNKSFDSAFKFSTWMYRIALNVAISFYRKERKLQIQRIPITEVHINIKEQAPECINMDEKSIMLQTHVAALNELDRALMLLYFEEKSYKEIAEIIGITETNVATKLNRIKDKLKQKINKKE